MTSYQKASTLKFQQLWIHIPTRLCWNFQTLSSLDNSFFTFGTFHPFLDWWHVSKDTLYNDLFTMYWQRHCETRIIISRNPSIYLQSFAAKYIKNKSKIHEYGLRFVLAHNFWCFAYHFIIGPRFSTDWE